jgi:hypothetical protein
LFPLQSVPRALLGNGHSITPRQCFLRGQFPGYIARAVQKAASLENDRPDLSSEGAPDIDKTVTVTQ